ncbi:pentatricopeptide repeat-containing protein At1g11900 [Neltuma alba]|uniref:pentatricopeptide repeat-containing protein At1g11900 n=1 Tax=Neltuma alba TaxID=207710 RepID=UPI0010A43953|nr:pentatricopeptide repeat-containing protein At1g11900 [Prosopis alba]XP_028806173.1 pentatricopeptide repeat-containing protein At1g11900 [Prosopis alba]XP_028806174.1 pentatricopeptide repeat-containing protein At1g11900 [Prosopis alba]
MLAAGRRIQLILPCISLNPSFNPALSLHSVYSSIFRISRCYLATEASPDKDSVSDEVLNDFLSVIENESAPSVEVCSAYIDKMCNAGNVSAARKMLKVLHDKNIHFSYKLYARLLVMASQKNDIDLSCQVFKKLLLSNESIGTTVYLNFSQAFTESSDCVELLSFVKEVLEMSRSSISVINRIIYAFAKSGQKDKALLIFDHLKRANFTLDLITYNIVLDILGRSGRMDEMLTEFASMEEVDIVPDFISYNTLINSLRRIGRFDMCLLYLRKMVESGIEPDLLTYAALIESFGRSGNVEASLELFRQMKMMKIRPSIYIYRSLIANLNRAGKFQLAAELSDEMNSSSTCLAKPEDFKPKGRQRKS